MSVYILIYLRKKNHWYPKVGSADPFFLWKKEFFFHFQKVFLADKKKICKNILFLWDKSFMNISNGIFVEQSGNVTLKGYEFL